MFGFRLFDSRSHDQCISDSWYDGEAGQIVHEPSDSHVQAVLVYHDLSKLPNPTMSLHDEQVSWVGGLHRFTIRGMCLVT